MNSLDLTSMILNPWSITIGGTVVAAAIIGIWKYFFLKKPTAAIANSNTSKATQNQSNNQSVTVNFFDKKNDTEELKTNSGITQVINVLFIDDDTRFKIVNILKKYPGINCQIIKDLEDFNTPSLVGANIVFIDIEGVGKILTPQEQGLGIVREIKTRYPNKYVVIYSSKIERNMTHPAFKLADGVLYKEAQPSEFLKHIEDARK